MSDRNQSLGEALANGDRIDRALREGVREALLRHHKLGQAISIWRDGRVVTVPAEQIPSEIERASGGGNGGPGGTTT